VAERTAVPVLLWHAVGDVADGDPFRVTTAAFRRHLDLVVASGRQPITAAEYGRVLRGESTGPQRPVVLTFDDGYADLLDEVVPQFAARGLCGTAFVTSGYVGRPGMLTPDGLRHLAAPQAATHLELGAHSVNHPHLDVLPPRAALAEIVDSGRALEDAVGRAVSSFAYPHGSHSARTRVLVRRAGYLTAHAVKNALSHPGDDVWGVARYTITAATPDERVRDVLDGAGAPFAPRRERLLTRGYRQVRRARHLAGRWTGARS